MLQCSLFRRYAQKLLRVLVANVATTNATPAYRLSAPHRFTGRPNGDRGGACRICKQPVSGKGRRGRLRRIHDGRLLLDGTREPSCHQQRGTCRVCKEPVAIGRNGRPRFWHDGRRHCDNPTSHEPNCLAEHKMRFNPSFAKRLIAKRDGAHCKRCGARRGRSFKWLALDHVLALKDGGSKEPDNLQLLCPACHTEKTSTENSDRARRRRRERAAALESSGSGAAA